jgi:hypothetical protein
MTLTWMRMGLCTSLIVAAAALEGEETKTLQEWCAAGCLWEEEEKKNHFHFQLYLVTSSLL